VTHREEAAIRHLSGQYRHDPIGYAADVLGALLTPQQERIARALTSGPRRVLVPSANKVGKTFAAGWLINWHHDSYDPGVVLATSTTGRQVKNQLFKEVRRLRPFGLGLMPRAPEIRHREDHLVIGFSTNKADGFQGNHEGNLLLVMDEATGVSPEFWDRAETMFSGEPGHGWVCFYNPHDPTTPAYAAEQTGQWTVVRLTALGHPNIDCELAGLPPPFPSAIRLKRVYQRIERECEDCGQTRVDETCFQFPRKDDGKVVWYKPIRPEFEVQILGRWPSKAFNSVWGDQDWKRCAAPCEINPDWPVQIGCDVARMGGDKTVFAVRKGIALIHLEHRTHWPTTRIGQHIADRLRELAIRYAPAGTDPKDIPCTVDGTGGYGSAVTDYPEGYNFIPINASERANDPRKFRGRRSELWFGLRLAADERCFTYGNIREGSELLNELGNDLKAARYVLDQQNRRVVEGKDGMRERLRRSPDYADAVNLAWYSISA
jgi:phage terminase large subunit